jgi:FMN-dependent NADH-azoreductase
MRDVGQDNVPIVNETWVGANFTPADARSDEQKAALALSDTLCAELFAADVVVIGAPMYNLTIAASLKAYLDQVCRAGVTFKYGASGPEGLLTGKKAIVVCSSGGVPMGSPLDFCTPYMKAILAFVGIVDVTFINGTGLMSDADKVKADAQTAIDALTF